MKTTSYEQKNREKIAEMIKEKEEDIAKDKLTIKQREEEIKKKEESLKKEEQLRRNGTIEGDEYLTVVEYTLSDVEELKRINEADKKVLKAKQKILEDIKEKMTEDYKETLESKKTDDTLTYRIQEDIKNKTINKSKIDEYVKELDKKIKEIEENNIALEQERKSIPDYWKKQLIYELIETNEAIKKTYSWTKILLTTRLTFKNENQTEKEKNDTIQNVSNAETKAEKDNDETVLDTHNDSNSNDIVLDQNTEIKNKEMVKKDKIFFNNEGIDSNLSNIHDEEYEENNDEYFLDSLITIDKARIGGGGSGTVYRGVDQDGREYAVKIFTGSDDDDEDSIKTKRRYFEREADNVLALLHPNIIKAYDFTTTAEKLDNYEENTLCMVMEYSKEGSLEKYLKKKDINVLKAINITLQILEALIYLEKKRMAVDTSYGKTVTIGLVHRDIKPANIFSFENYTVFKLGDFGLSKTWKTAGYSEDGYTNNNAKRLGSVGYMSYFQLLDPKNVTPFSDLWSCIAVLYRMLCGETTRTSNTEKMLLNTDNYGYIPVKSLSERNLDMFKDCPNGLKEELITFVDGIINEERHLEDGFKFTTASEAKEQLLNIRNKYYN